MRVLGKSWGVVGRDEGSFFFRLCAVEGHEILDVSYDGLQPRLLCRFFTPEPSGRI